jgi:ATP-binding cassette subfamily C (CFTR/MRP) protein 1
LLRSGKYVRIHQVSNISFVNADAVPAKEVPGSLFKLAFKHHRRTFASVIPPRIIFSAFNFSQPFLLQRTLKYLTTNDYSNRPAIGWGLIAAYVLVYTGYGISNAYHQHRNYRSVSKLRGSLIGIIYKQTLTMSSSALAESDAVTLMNADVERITVGLRQSQELWASFFEMALATYLLHRQISWAALTPLGVILLCTSTAIAISPKLAQSQKTWLDKIQARVDATASMLGSIKAVKMTGLTPDLGSRIHNLRETEIQTASTFRGMLVKITTASFASTSVSPVFALGTYIFMAKYQGYPNLTLDRALTSLVLMQLLLEPTAFFITALSGLINTMSCMNRIQNYLNTEKKDVPSLHRSRTSMRQSRGGAGTSNPSELTLGMVSEESPLNSPQPNEGKWASIGKTKAIAEKQMAMSFVDLDMGDDATLASLFEKSDCIVAENASCGWDKEKNPTLTDLNFRIKEGTLTMVVGPVSSGKSTLLRAILGEIPVSEGLTRSFHTEVAYCSQVAWLVNGTFRDNVIHGSEFDEEWYDQVIAACDLEIDIANMALGDQTIVGSKGMGLSGGQQQRVALARAVYFRRSIIIIDDVLCGLDASTENHVFESVFGNQGLLRDTDTTIIFVSNAVHRLHQADHIIAMGTDGKITEQGTFDELSKMDGYVGNMTYNAEPHAPAPKGDRPAIKKFNQSLVTEKEKEEIAEEIAGGDATIYAYYIRTFGWFKWTVFCFFCALYGFGTAFPSKSISGISGDDD